MTTENQLIAMWKKSLEVYERFRHSASDAAPGDSFSNKSLVTLHSDMDAILVGTQLSAVENTVLQARADMVTFLSGAKTAIQRHVTEYKVVSGLAGSGFDTLWPKLFRYMMENSKRVLSRGIVFGAVSAGGSNVGNGTVYRLKIDAWGQTIENGTAGPSPGDGKLIRCTRDSVNGALLGEEEFSVESTTAAGRDALEELGSGKEATSPLVGISSRNAQQFGLQNPSFSSCTPAGVTASPTDLGGFTSEVTLGGSALPISGTNYAVISPGYRGYEGDTTTYALNVIALAWCLSQNLDTNGATFDTDKAYYFHVAVRRQSSADGTLTLTVGRSTVSVALSSLTNNVWSLIQIPLTAACWYKNFGQPNVKWSLARSGGTTGTVDVDDWSAGVFQGFDGNLLAVVGGATPFSIEDKFTFTDIEYGGLVTGGAGTAGNAIWQKWNWRVLGLYQPSCPQQPTQPTAALAGAGAGNIDNGTHRYWTTFTDVNGIESGLSAASSDVNVTDKTTNGKITATRGALPATTTHLASWSVYRSTQPANNTAKLVQSGIALGTTNITDNTADAGLGATHAGHSITHADPP